MRKLDFIATSEAITGYADSKLAKTENRDCVVRAVYPYLFRFAINIK